MSEKEQDADILQILDESNKKWVKLWSEASTKEACQTNNVVLVFSPKDEALQIVTTPKRLRHTQ